MFLKEKDYLSIWEVAHRWADLDPDSTNPQDLPEQVRYFIHKLIEGFLDGEIILRRSSGYRVPRDPAWIFFFCNINIWQKELWKCLTHDVFNKDKLSNMFVRRSELLKLCEKEDVKPPAFWVKERISDTPAVKPNINNRPKEEETDRLLCQAIAATLWTLDPNIHPAHMAKSKVIQRYGQGRSYKDLNTVKRWIAEVDPLKNQRNSGRPPDIQYKITLEMDSLLED